MYVLKPMTEADEYIAGSCFASVASLSKSALSVVDCIQRRSISCPRAFSTPPRSNIRRNSETFPAIFSPWLDLIARMESLCMNTPRSVLMVSAQLTQCSTCIAFCV